MQNSWLFLSSTVTVDTGQIDEEIWIPTLRVRGGPTEDEYKLHAFVHFVAAYAILNLHQSLYTVSHDRFSVGVQSTDGSKNLAIQAWMVLNAAVEKARSHIS